jgi:hypothetical protein
MCLLLLPLDYCEEHAMGAYGLRQIRSMTTTMAMTVAASTPGRTTRLNTSSPREAGLVLSLKWNF